MKTVVLAYHEIGCAGLDFLKEAGAEITGVFTHEDDPSENVWFGSVAQRAKDYGLRVYAPAQINDPEWVQVIRACEPEILSLSITETCFRQDPGDPSRGCYTSMVPSSRAFADAVPRLGNTSGGKENRCNPARDGRKG